MNIKKIIIGGLIVITLGVGVYYYYSYYGGATSDKKRKRKIVFRKKSNFSGADGKGVVGRTELTFDTPDKDAVVIDVPAMEAAFYKSSELPLIKSKLALIDKAYGVYIKNSARISNVKEEIIKAFIWVESAGNPNVIGGQSVGLMQINPPTAQDVIKMELKKGRLNNEEKAIIKKYLGNNVNFSNPTVTVSDLKKPEFNILIGTLYLGILIDEETTTYANRKICRLDYVITRYNQGYYKFRVGLKPSGDVAEVCSKVGITCGYIKKVLGVNGVLDILTA